jgi:hypothetical protein
MLGCYLVVVSLEQSARETVVTLAMTLATAATAVLALSLFAPSSAEQQRV